MELPQEHTTMEDMLAMAQAKKSQLGASVLAKPYEGSSVPKLPEPKAPPAPSSSPSVTPEADQDQTRIGNAGKKRKELARSSTVGRKKKRNTP
ncbi:hypothetical protein FRC11_010854 [Ceratobasidium sp. 423]|nr:hypothetical protein FRC11_010854 [Ceratobasidium sp. 423]